MPTAVAAKDIAGIQEIAERSEVDIATARSWVALPTFPAPIAALTIGNVYLLTEVDEWLKARV